MRESVWLLGSVAASAALMGVVFWEFMSRSGLRRRVLSLPPSEDALAAPIIEAQVTSSGAAEAALVAEQLSRLRAFFGEERLEMIRNALVVVVGVGGVGSHAASMLARSGVGRIRIVDFDQVTLSSLNRHAVATRADVGEAKVVVLRRHLLQIVPFVDVEIVREMYTEQTADRILGGNPDYVLDCIDNIGTKVHLLKTCKERSIRVIGSMGAGAKGDPSRIQVADIQDTTTDPLSKAVRRRLKREAGIESGIPVVFSTEIPEVGLLPAETVQGEDVAELQLIPDFRVRILPVLGPLPAMFGNAMAAYVLQFLSGKELAGIHVRQRDQLYQKLLQRYQMRERDVYHFPVREIPLDDEDVAYLMEEIWRCRSCLSGSYSSLTLVRWDRSRLPSITNVVPMTSREAEEHHRKAALSEYPSDVRGRVEARLLMEQRIEQLR